MSEENNLKINQQKEELNRTLYTMFDYLDLKGELKIEEKNGKLHVKITSDDAGRIIGRKGQILESLQLLANRILFKKMKSFPTSCSALMAMANAKNAAAMKRAVTMQKMPHRAMSVAAIPAMAAAASAMSSLNSRQKMQQKRSNAGASR